MKRVVSLDVHTASPDGHCIQNEHCDFPQTANPNNNNNPRP